MRSRQPPHLGHEFILGCSFSLPARQHAGACARAAAKLIGVWNMTACVCSATTTSKADKLARVRLG